MFSRILFQTLYGKSFSSSYLSVLSKHSTHSSMSLLAFVSWQCITEGLISHDFWVRNSDSDVFFCVFLEDKSYFNALTWASTICLKWYCSIRNAALELRRKENQFFSSLWTSVYKSRNSATKATLILCPDQYHVVRSKRIASIRNACNWECLIAWVLAIISCPNLQFSQ